MNARQLIKYIDNPDTLITASLSELDAVIRAYPYFQTARVVYLKKLSLSASPEFNVRLEKNIVYCGDKRKLFLYLTSDRSEWVDIMRKRESKIPNVFNSAGFELIETFLRQT